jgi:SAM-dependent methyltransferase
VDLWTHEPRVAAVYDTECSGRWDHDFYLTLARDVGATRVVDIGCGTGVFAIDVTRQGCAAIGVDPASAMLDIARTRPGGENVQWILGHADDVPSAAADLVVMMGHVAQYFVDDAAWTHVLDEVHRILMPGGRLTFETRNPAIDWAHEWTPARTTTVHPHPDGGTFTAWVEMGELDGTPESYATVHAGHTVLPDGTHLEFTESLRFRSAAEVFAALDTAGFEIEQTWGDWDRSPLAPGSRELIVLAHAR